MGPHGDELPEQEEHQIVRLHKDGAEQGHQQKQL